MNESLEQCHNPGKKKEGGGNVTSQNMYIHHQPRENVNVPGHCMQMAQCHRDHSQVKKSASNVTLVMIPQSLSHEVTYR
jgi:hypothetical protein